MLAPFCEALAPDVVARALEPLGHPDVGLHGQPNRNRGAGGERLEGNRQAVTADHGGMDAARDSSELLEGQRYLPARLAEAGLGLLISIEPPFEESEFEGECDH